MKGLRLLRPKSKVVLVYPGCLLMKSGRKASCCGFLRKLHLIIAIYQLRVKYIGASDLYTLIPRTIRAENRDWSRWGFVSLMRKLLTIARSRDCILLM